MAVEPEFEDVAERILEILQTDKDVQRAVLREVFQRFPADHWNMTEEQRDEIVCMQQIITYKRILGGIIE